jgi:hypothetical protein
MAKQTDIAPEEVGQVVQDYIDEGHIKVTAVKQDDGTWTVTAVKPK